MNESLCILGRQPEIGMAELESLYGPDALQPLSPQAVIVKLPTSAISFSRLGGTMKLAEVSHRFKGMRWQEVEKHIIQHPLNYISAPASGKLNFGISLYDISAELKLLQVTGIRLKQALRKHGQPARVVPNQDLALSSAQVLHNNLDGRRGYELIFVKDGDDIVLGRTVSVQDITAYTRRDRERPKRDARVGMLPPKLAQILVNLANPGKGATVLDPFCGTGVVLQEAALMDFKPYGSDNDERMVEYSQANLEWLGIKNNIRIEVGDAQIHRWQAFDAVASETYLGRPFTISPSVNELSDVIIQCNALIETFLRNIRGQILSPDTRLSLAIPAWKIVGAEVFEHLPLLDHLETLGYNRVSFVHSEQQALLYYRPSQIVARELVILTRK